MATYKVIQDIEADDKLLGPLSLRQFVYAGITVFCLWLCYFSLTKGAFFMVIVFLPPAIITGFFAFPWGREQPTEVWALARIRFIFKPRKRIWNQAGIKELVTITAPKKIEKVYTDGLSQMEVKSRLQALASTIDSRGWAIKSAAMSPYTATPVVTMAGTSDDDRLIDIGTLPQAVPNDDTTAYDDVFDATNNPKAQQFDMMLEQNAQAQRERLVSQMQQPTAAPQSVSQSAPDYWLLNQPNQPRAAAPTPVNASPEAVVTSSPVSDTDEQVLVEELRSKEAGQTMQYSHLPTILPLSEQKKNNVDTTIPAVPPSITSNSASAIPQSPPVTAEPDTAILELATKDDWNISTIARQAKKAHGEEPDEVVISLH